MASSGQLLSLIDFSLDIYITFLVSEWLYKLLHIITLQGLSTFSMKLPLVVLACVGEQNNTNVMSIRDVIAGLRLQEFNL